MLAFNIIYKKAPFCLFLLGTNSKFLEQFLYYCGITQYDGINKHWWPVFYSKLDNIRAYDKPFVVVGDELLLGTTALHRYPVVTLTTTTYMPLLDKNYVQYYLLTWLQHCLQQEKQPKMSFHALHVKLFNDLMQHLDFDPQIQKQIFTRNYYLPKESFQLNAIYILIKNFLENKFISIRDFEQTASGYLVDGNLLNAILNIKGLPANIALSSKPFYISRQTLSLAQNNVLNLFKRFA